MPTSKEIEQKLESLGYSPPHIYKDLGDGRVAWVSLLLFTDNILVADFATIDKHYDEEWSYPTVIEARIALLNWDTKKDKEPTGWHRHKPSNRRRLGGNPAREEIRP